MAETEAQLTRAIAAGRPDVAIDPERIGWAIEQSRFEKLQAREARDGFREKLVAGRFFRSGRANDWPKHLNSEQVRRICTTQGAVMRRFGYDPDGLQEQMA